MTELKRTIGPVALTLYGLGTVLGAGIYVLVGEVAAEAGVWAPLSFALAAAVAGLTGLSFGELAARIPESAGEAAYVERGFGSAGLASVVGLVVATTGVVSAAAISVGFAGYLQIFFPGASDALAVAGLVVVLGIIASVGIEASVAAAGFMTLLEVAGLLLVLWSARSVFTTEAWSQAASGPMEPSGVFVGAFLAFYAFIGFEDMVNNAEEVVDPERTMPKAILGALVVSTVLYIAVALVCVLALPVEELAGAKAPLALVYERATGADPWVISAISLVAVSNGALVQIIMGGRVLYGLARKGWIPGFLAQVHPRTQTPIVATGVIVVVVLVLALLFPLRTLAQVTSFAILGVFALVNAALVQMKRRGETGPSVNLPIAVPAVGVVASLGLIGLRAWSLI